MEAIESVAKKATKFKAYALAGVKTEDPSASQP